MKRFYLAGGVFILMEFAAIILHRLSIAGIWLVLSIALIFVAFLARASYRICSGVYIRALCRKDPSSRQVAITFDDGPYSPESRKILDTLDRFSAPATFFLIGQKIPGNESLVLEMIEKGHSIGNHSMSHSNLFPFFSGKKIADEIRQCSALIESIGGNKVRFFRPPFGVSNPRIARGLRPSGLRVIGWSIRSFDTRGEAPDIVIRRIKKGLKGGDIILLHESSTAISEILEQILIFIEQQGLQCVNMDDFYKNAKQS